MTKFNKANSNMFEETGIDAEQRSIQSEDLERIQKVYVLVYADDPESASFKAHMIMYGIDCYHRGQIVYYHEKFAFELTGFGEEPQGTAQPIQVSTSACPAKYLQGVELVNSIIEEINDRYEKNLEIIRYFLDTYSSDQLFQCKESVKIEGTPFKDVASAFRFHCSCAADPANLHIKLFDPTGNLVESPEHLRCLLEPEESEELLSFDRGLHLYDCWGPHIWKKPLWLFSYTLHPFPAQNQN
jgi:hypothetical protein